MLRFAFLEKVCQECGARKIALAHTADDQAEEILLRLIRGTARKGLSGMKMMRDATFIRPFLHFPKSILLEYLDKYSIPFLFDSSNTQDHFLRNRARNELLPFLAARYNPNIRETLIRTAAILEDEEELLETITTAAFAETVAVAADNFKPAQAGRSQGAESFPPLLQLDCRLFAMQPRAIQRRILEKCCWRMNCSPRSRLIEQILQLARPNSGAETLHLTSGLRITKAKGCLFFAYPLGPGPWRGDLATDTGTAVPETRIPAPGSYDFPALQKKLVIKELGVGTPEAGDFPAGSEYLDGDLFSFPLTLRGPLAGDRFHPLGAPGRRKVSDFLNDQKIGRQQRKQVPVLCADNTILALPGLRIDHHFRITDATTRIVRLSWEDLPAA